MKKLLLAAIVALTLATASVVHAQASCFDAYQAILQWGGELEVLSETPFDSVIYVTFMAYFPLFGEWWYGSCFE